MRLLICAGGTGGGVYPALAVLQAQSDPDPAWMRENPVLWIGGEGGMEEDILSRQDIRYRTIPAAGLHGVGLRKLPGNLAKLARGYLKARQIIREFKPDVLFFTGGYLAVPAALAGRGIPSLVYVPDIEPGLALKAVSRLASCVAVSTEAGRDYAPPGKPVLVSGYPIRPEMLDWSREQAREKFGLDQDLPVVLVMGGSRGARSINLALEAVLPRLLAEVQVVHITGKLDFERASGVLNGLDQELRDRCRVFDYLHHRMGAALACADLVISRSGASVLGEYPQFRLPSILVPYPYAWRYQKTNARYLEDRGAAVVIEDQDLQEKLLPEVLNLIHDPDRLAEMRRSLGKLAAPDAAARIGQELVSLASGGSQP